MAGTKPIPIRLTQAVIDRLDAAAAKVGVNRAVLVRFCTMSWLEAYERGEVGFGPDWNRIRTGASYSVTLRAATLNDADDGDATLEAEAAAEAAAFGRREGASPGRVASAPIPAGPGAARTVPPDPKHKGKPSR